jgi:KDO2-lipid IV(A) lauroyltransferase
MTFAQCTMIRGLLRALPRRAVYAGAELVADLQWRTAARERAAVAANLSIALGREVSPQATEVREVFRNFGRYLVEFLSMHEAGTAAVTVEGAEYLAQAHRAGKGVVALAAHLGNWELGAVCVRRLGVPMATLALPHADPRVDDLFNAQRARCGVAVIPLGPRAVGESLQWLRVGGVLGMMGDLDAAEGGICTPYCGRLVTLPRGPALLSLRSGAPVVPAYLVREAPLVQDNLPGDAGRCAAEGSRLKAEGTHFPLEPGALSLEPQGAQSPQPRATVRTGASAFRLIIEPPIWPCEEGREAVALLTQRYAEVLERYVRRFPEQWLLLQELGARPSSRMRSALASAPAARKLREVPHGTG